MKKNKWMNFGAIDGKVYHFDMEKRMLMVEAKPQSTWSYILLICRIWITKASKLPEILQERNAQKIFIYPRYITKLILHIMAYLFSALTTIAIVYAVFTNQINNYILHIGLLIAFTFWLIIGNLFFLSVFENYWVRSSGHEDDRSKDTYQEEEKV